MRKRFFINDHSLSSLSSCSHYRKRMP